ncbi:IS4 family transposase [Ideonella sp.]|uniref:IS4 family transposase n=1 Tax=Ideonella sp. TaxID=1929293 RepID=UPI0037BE365F
MDFAELIASESFAHRARHPDFPQAFTRTRKLPLPALVGSLLCLRGQSVQGGLDHFFGTLCGATDGALGVLRHASDRAFAKARSRLHQPALAWLNDWVVQRAQATGFVPRWQGLRLVAADASVLMPAVRSCHRTRSAASAEQRLFALYLPQAELTLHASVHSAAVSERAMLVEALGALGPDDVLLLDRGYPASWLVSLLQARGIRFVMRCDNTSGWAAGRKFMRGDTSASTVTLSAPKAQDVADWACPAAAPEVRLVRHVASTGNARLLATNLPPEEIPAECFGQLYHARWRVEEAFKRLKHRWALESVSGLTQQALLLDVAAKVLADNLASLMCAAATPALSLSTKTGKTTVRHCQRAYAAGLLPKLLPSLLIRIGDVLTNLVHALHALAATTYRALPGRSVPRPKRRAKPHARYAYKG